MTIQTAIEKAIYGGYDNREVIVGVSTIRYNSPFLDTQFWQCLGKAMEWSQICIDCHTPDKPRSKRCDCNPVGGTNYPDYQDEWLYRWHRMIDHLAEGGTIESYFAQL